MVSMLSVLSAGAVLFDQVNYPPLRYLWQQIPNTVFHSLVSLFQHRAYYPRANRTRLPKVDEKAVEF